VKYELGPDVILFGGNLNNAADCLKRTPCDFMHSRNVRLTCDEFGEGGAVGMARPQGVCFERGELPDSQLLRERRSFEQW
jgi:hypothetical protein